MNVDHIREELMKIEEVCSVEELNVWSLTAGKTIAIVNLILGRVCYVMHVNIATCCATEVEFCAQIKFGIQVSGTEEVRGKHLVQEEKLGKRSTSLLPTVGQRQAAAWSFLPTSKLLSATCQIGRQGLKVMTPLHPPSSGRRVAPPLSSE